MGSFDSLLREGIVICDGAMGTLLQRHGIPPTYPYKYANLTHAEPIQSLHREYVVAGARIVETNSYGANRFKLAGPGMAGRVAEISRAAALNARAAAPAGVLVAGAVGGYRPPPRRVRRALSPNGRPSPANAAGSTSPRWSWTCRGAWTCPRFSRGPRCARPAGATASTSRTARGHACA